MGFLFLHETVPAHRALATQKKLAYLGVQCLDHPPYSPDLVPSDYNLFPGLKKQLLPRRPGWTDNIMNSFLRGFQKLEQRSKKRAEPREEYVE